MEKTFLKVQGSNSTFYLYDTDNVNEFDWVSLVQWMCDDDNEGGADGLLIVLPSEVADARMRVIKANGSEVSMCGNGLRCVSRYLCEKLQIEKAVIETMKVNLHVQKEPSIFGDIPTYGVEISPISFDLPTLPFVYRDYTKVKNQIIPEFSSTIPYTAVSVPNPHLIGVVDKHFIHCQTHQFELAKLLNSPNDFFEEGVNVSYFLPMNDDRIFVRTFEQGIGFTNACGTAMTASALVAKLNHLVTGNDITVFNPGGFVKCRVTMTNNQYELKLIGNATVIAYYQLSVDDNQCYQWVSHKYTDEQKDYQLLIDYVKTQLKDIL